MINLRPIQRVKLDKVSNILKDTNEVCLAGSVGSGKTVMAMAFIEETPGTFYIQTYGQNVILDMWRQRMNTFMSPKAIARTTIGLPQSYAKKSKIKYDYIIIDEAHQFTDASMTQTILLENPQAKRIYLTATPSPFVLKKTPIVCLSGLELFKLGLSSDVYLGCVSTNTNIRKDDRNAALNVTTEALAALSDNIPADMAKLYTGIIKRLRQIEILKARPVLSKKVTWANMFATLYKTIFFCESIKQSEEVVKFLNTKNIKCVSSHSKNDINSEQIALFQTDKTIAVLVVVDRAQAGFDMPDLVNVVDMTFTHNPNRLYQMYGRVTRQSEEHELKYFFKITNDSEILVTKFYMNVMINMLDETFITRFNGTNLRDMEIPIRVQRERVERGPTESIPRESSTPRFNIDEDFFNTVSVNDHFKFIENKMGSEFNEYANVKISEIRSIEFGNIIRDSAAKKQAILDCLERPTGLLAKSMMEYINPKSATFDFQFKNKLIEKHPTWAFAKEEFITKVLKNSYNRMLNLKPKCVQFAANQQWKGVDVDYTFICDEFGEFITKPSILTRKNGPWEKEESGHPYRGRAKTTEYTRNKKGKRVKNKTTGTIYKTITAAALSIKKSNSEFTHAIKNKRQCGGFNWEYVD